MSGCCGFACILALEEQCGELGAACVLQSRPDPVGARPAERLFRSRQLALREAGAPVPWLEVPRVSWPC